MKLGSAFRDEQTFPILFLSGGKIVNLASVYKAGATSSSESSVAADTLVTLIGKGKHFLELCRAIEAHPEHYLLHTLDLSAVKVMAPIPKPPKNVFCLGRNYADHIQEDNASRDKQTPLPEYPQFFTKPHTSIIAHGDEVELDEQVTKRLDYEVELAVVIGSGGRNISEQDSYAHVFGYTIINDVTARDLQRRHDQWFKGKALDTFCPMGPWIVTAEEISDPHALKIRLSVNGEPRQDASTGDMIFKIPQIIASLSAGLTLEPGDVIATGTPSGVGYAMDPRQFLRSGDRIECSIEGVGILANSVRGIHRQAG